MIACAAAHSKTKSLFTAVLEDPLPRPRVHVGAGLHGEGFPNRCRHCDPAPCMLACLPGAISRDPDTQTVVINPDTCINCASCAMACPFGVIRYHEDAAAPAGKTVAVKCDNCLDRQHRGQIPACVDACKSGALTFEAMDEAQRRKTREVARTVSRDAGCEQLAPGFSLLNAVKRSQIEMQQR
jgi:carbon-monoxide dehydrogenase iron sulfur subunit